MAAPEDGRPLQQSKKARRRLVLFSKAGASLLFLVILLHFINASDFLETVRRIDLRYLALSMVVSGFMIFISCLKWKLFLDLQQKPVPLRLLMRYYYIGYYFSNLLPSNVGGDVARAYYAGRHIKSHGHAAISVFMERGTGLLLLLLLAVLAPACLPGLFTHPGIIVPAFLAASLLVLLAVLLMMRRHGRDLGRWLHRILDGLIALPGGRGLRRSEGGMRAMVERFASSLAGLQEKFAALVRVLRNDQLALLQVTLITVLFYLLTFLNVYVSCLAFGEEPSLLAIAAVVPAAILVSMVPVSLGSLGLTEGAYVFYLGLIGINSAASLAMALLFRFKMLVNGLIGLVLSHRAVSPGAGEP
ncbi:MAG: lysylphosphatidylglycerol synthase transmembrane domain-containing protein [Desulfobacteraceae bacterium]|nr:lysylphosphatidylglycerol synthase transmembrane domain-containing protein [Desulfobacteraceae bacterium]